MPTHHLSDLEKGNNMTTLDLDLLAQSDKALEHFKKGEIFLAKDICYDNLEKNAHHSPTLNLLGIILFKEGNSDKGIEHLKNAIKYVFSITFLFIDVK